MSSIRKHARLFLIAFGVALAIPVALTVASNPASGSGYLLASGLTGNTICLSGGADDCPDGNS